MQQLRLVGVSFHGAGKIFDFDALELELAPGEKVIVETERGRALGTVITAPRTISPDEAPPKLKAVVRQASESDLELAAANEARGQEALKFCQQRVNERKMEMKLVRAEYLYDGSKIIFYFTADGRVDFRDLVRDLAQHFRTRIEMRQIGVRDEAKMVGGLGICGRELCCSNHLREFAPVSVKMAKAQGLALNPTKISGQCGRLLCCLAYEYETYSELIKALPKCGKKLQLSKCQAEVVALDILAQKVTLSKADGERIVLGVDELRDEMAGKPAQSEPADTSKSAEENAQATSTDSADNSDNDQKKQVRRNDRRKRRPDNRERKERPQQQQREQDNAKTKNPPAPQQPGPAKEGTDEKKRPKRRRRPRRRGKSGENQSQGPKPE